MSKKMNRKEFFKLNKNKKGFSLVELLCAVAILAIVTPVLVNGFIYASKLNYRSRLQQRVDEAANFIYEGVAAVEFEELEDYFLLNGWEDVKPSGSEYEYVMTRPYEGFDGCQVTVEVKKFTSSYVVPQLNLIGVNSQYLTLANEINSSDDSAERRISQAIKRDANIKNQIAAIIAEQISGTYSVSVSASEIARSNKLLIDCGEIDTSNISKQTSIKVKSDLINDKLVADYSVSYKYPAYKPQPESTGGAGVKVSYTYSHLINGKWYSFSGTSVDVGEITVRDVKKGTVSKDVERETNGVATAQKFFIYYSPYSKYDWVDIDNESPYIVDAFLVEQAKGDVKLNLGANRVDADNNFEFSSVVKSTESAILTQGGYSINFYSNNTDIFPDGIPDRVYQSSSAVENMYRIKVSVVYDTEYFADVSGNFKTGESVLSDATS